MTINPMDLKWTRANGPKLSSGLVISLPDIDGLFSGDIQDELVITPASLKGTYDDGSEFKLRIFCDLPEKFSLPTGPPAMKFVGDPERGTARNVYEYIGKDSGLDFRLGMTIHEGRGTWSSEPHDFELEALKSLKPMRFWEKFAYITDPPSGWGIQTRQGFLDGKWMQDTQIIRDRDILDIPLGVHMVTAGPGVRLAYIWVYQAENISAAEKF